MERACLSFAVTAARRLPLAGSEQRHLRIHGLRVRPGGAATDDVEDAYRALSIVLAARQSFDTGKRMYLPMNGQPASSAGGT